MNRYDFVTQGARRGGIVGGLAGAAIGGAAWGLPKNRVDWQTKRIKKRSTTDRVVSGLVGGALGAHAGHTFGSAVGARRRATKWDGGFRPRPTDIPDWLKGAKTKAEARKLYHKESRKAHPDLGGSTEAQSRLNEEWSKHEPFFKEAMLVAFAEELEKLAAVRRHASR